MSENKVTTSICNPGEKTTAICIIMIGVLGYFFAMKMTSENYYSPSVIPKLTSIMIGFFGIVAFYKTRSKQTCTLSFLQMLQYYFPKDVFALLLLLIVYSVILPFAGFNIASILFLCTAMTYLQRGKHVVLSVIVSILSVAILFLVFRYLFLVVLP